MWITVLVLAIAVNIEPTRFVMLPLLMARERPMSQLLAYLAGSVSVSLAFGFLILFVFHRNPLGTSAAGGGKAQIAVGMLALAIACIMVVLSAWKDRRRYGQPMGDAPTDGGRSRIQRFNDHVRKFLSRGQSPWIAGLLGMSVGIPSVDYLAVLLVIGASDKSPYEQGAALVFFVVTSSLVVMAPLIGYQISPVKTLSRIERFAAFTRSRSQIEYAGLLALIGLLLIGVGASHL